MESQLITPSLWLLVGDAEWKKVRPNIDYHVEIDRHYYSVPQFVVLLPLRCFELTENRLLCLGRQFACNLSLGAPENEWPQRLCQQPTRLLARISRQSTRQFQHFRA
jgi:hypothetical protein